MDKIKLSELASVTNGYSNKIKLGTVPLKILNAKNVKANTFEEGKFSMREETIKKLTINENSIVISNIGSYSIFEYGYKYIGMLTGKGLYKLEIKDPEIPVEYLMAILKSRTKKLPYEGNIIKLLKIRDLENILIPLPSKKIIESIANLEKYNVKLIDQKDLISDYTKSIIREIYAKNK